MKLQQIEKGRMYAIGSPMARDVEQRICGRVDRIGVRGPTIRRGRPALTRQTMYVEFRRLGVPESSERVGAYVLLLTDASIGSAEERIPDFDQLDSVPVVEVLRCPASHVLMTWPEHLRKMEELVQRRRKGAEVEGRHRLRAHKIREAFAEKGYPCGGCSPLAFEFDTSTALRLLAVLDPENARWLSIAADIERCRDLGGSVET